MTTSTRFMRHGGQPAGITEQQAVTPLFFQDALFFRAQAQLKRTPLRSSAQPAVGPLFTGIEGKSNDERRADYEHKLTEGVIAA